MTLDDIYNLLQSWFIAWLIFEVFKILSVDFKKIAALFRGVRKE